MLTSSQQADLVTPTDDFLSAKDVLLHGKQVSKYAYLIARELGFAGDELEELKQAVVFHDLGEVFVPTSLLHKPNALTVDEYKVVQAHTTNGYTVLRQGDVKIMCAAADLALKHHENLDGSGYPRGLSAADLSIEDRIIRVADTFDAITSWRPYRPAGNTPDALTAIWLNVNSYFDSRVVMALESALKREPKIDAPSVSETQVRYVNGLIERVQNANGVKTHF